MKVIKIYLKVIECKGFVQICSVYCFYIRLTISCHSFKFRTVSVKDRHGLIGIGVLRTSQKTTYVFVSVVTLHCVWLTECHNSCKLSQRPLTS